MGSNETPDITPDNIPKNVGVSDILLLTILCSSKIVTSHYFVSVRVRAGHIRLDILLLQIVDTPGPPISFCSFNMYQCCFCLQRIMLVVSMKTNIQSEMIRTTTMMPCRDISYRQLDIQQVGKEFPKHNKKENFKFQ